MITLDDLKRENKQLRANLSGVRGLLPRADMADPDAWLTLDQAGDLLDLSSTEVQLLIQGDSGTELAKDGRGRQCVFRDDLDKLLANFHTGADPGAMAIRLAQGHGMKNTL